MTWSTATHCNTLQHMTWSNRRHSASAHSLEAMPYSAGSVCVCCSVCVLQCVCVAMCVCCNVFVLQCVFHKSALDPFHSLQVHITTHTHYNIHCNTRTTTHAATHEHNTQVSSRSIWSTSTTFDSLQLHFHSLQLYFIHFNYISFTSITFDSLQPHPILPAMTISKARSQSW